MLALLFLFSTLAHAIVVSGPSGPWPVSHHVVELTDESRWDPYAPEDNQHKRRILTSFFIPVHEDQQECEVDKIDYLPPKTAETWAKVASGVGLPSNTFEGFELAFCKPTSKKQPRHPVAQSLASQGNVAITVDHPYEATIVEFPDGEVVYGATADEINPESAQKAVKVRSQDISFLIDQISAPSKLGDNIAGKLDTKKIFVYGHSLGGATSAQVASVDDRVLGGLDFDGALVGSVEETGLDKPFFIVGADSTENATSYYQDFIDKVGGPKMLTIINGTKHMTFSDLPLLLSLRDDVPPDSKPVIEQVLGTIDGKRAAIVVNKFLGAVTSFLFKRNAGPLCKFEDEVPEAELVERDLKTPYCE
ncbi:hypothetical protein NM208_g2022 [Fusarium decemcellulare]|uniref:Uncharacterized protein n=1 Tax=Fusarium decemcellulare TaxID=57161 RepID=A0ACC1SU80_9HYPO|nr:hypothetical protein NM208_g2022 [Fusarium decemcellulare]